MPDDMGQPLVHANASPAPEPASSAPAHDAPPHGEPAVEAKAIKPAHLKKAGIAAACVAGVIVVGGVAARVSADQELRSWNSAQQIPTIDLAEIKPSGAQDLSLPGQLEALNSAPIHARVSGYLKAWYADIGASVKAGQLLAVIDTPDLDQQVLQARADLATAEANQKLSQTTATRWADLLSHDAVSRQEADEKNGDLAARTSAVNAAKANLDRLLTLESFKRITAPFDGVVTARSTDIGALIAAGSPTDVPLFTVADKTRIRIYVHVPQNYSGLVRPGMNATLTLPDYPGQTFPAQVMNDAQAVDQRSGSMLVQLQTDNADGRLKPGAYAQVAFSLPSLGAGVQIPATAIQYQHGAPQVAVVGRDNRVRLRTITIGRDMGTVVQVSAGLTAKDSIVDNPSELLANGDLVRVSGASAAAHSAEAADRHG